MKNLRQIIIDKDNKIITPKECKVFFGKYVQVIPTHDIIKNCISFSIPQAKNFNQRGTFRGSNKNRTKIEMFADTFQGKIIECTLHSYFKKKGFDCSKVDFAYYEGVQNGDSNDLTVIGLRVQVKSCLFYANLMLLVKEEIDEYIENEGVKDTKFKLYDKFVLGRLSPSIRDIIQNSELWKNDFDEDHISKLEHLVASVSWETDIVGSIGWKNVKRAVDAKHIIPQGSYLGRKIVKTDNYYVVASDLRSPLKWKLNNGK